MSPVEWNCTVDADCPAELMCLNRASPPSTFCDCHLWYGRHGPECDGWGPNAVILVGSSLGIAACALAALVPAIVLQVRVGRIEGPRILHKAANSTLLLVSIGLVALAAGQVSYAFEAILPLREGSTLVVHTDSKKRSIVKAYTAVFNVAYQTFGFLSCLNVSVMWVEITERSRKMEMVTSENVDRYRRVCFVVGTLFASAMTACVATQNTSLAVFVGQPLILPLAVAFRIGRSRLVRMLAEAVEVSADNDMAVRARKTIQGVNRCSWHVSTGLFVMLGAGVSIFLFNMVFPDRLHCRPHKVCYAVVLSQVTILSMLYIDLHILRYSMFMVSKHTFGIGSSLMGNSKVHTPGVTETSSIGVLGVSDLDSTANPPAAAAAGHVTDNRKHAWGVYAAAPEPAAQTAPSSS